MLAVACFLRLLLFARFQYYYNAKTTQWMYWDAEKSTYLPAPTQGTESTTSTETESTTQAQGDKTEKEEKKEKEKTKVAKKIAKVGFQCLCICMNVVVFM